MRTLFAAIIVVTAGATSVLAQPMWEVSDRWTCEVKSHVKMGTDGSNIRVNEEANTQTIDFAEGTIATGFTDLTGAIGKKTYHESRYGGFNVLDIFWGGQPYPKVIVEKNGEWWETAGSGHADDDRTIWIANYQCTPG